MKPSTHFDTTLRLERLNGFRERLGKMLAPPARRYAAWDGKLANPWPVGNGVATEGQLRQANAVIWGRQ